MKLEGLKCRLCRPPRVPSLSLRMTKPEERVVCHDGMLANPACLRDVVAERAVDRIMRASPRHVAKKLSQHEAGAAGILQMKPKDSPTVIVRCGDVSVGAFEERHVLGRPLECRSKYVTEGRPIMLWHADRTYSSGWRHVNMAASSVANGSCTCGAKRHAERQHDQDARSATDRASLVDVGADVCHLSSLVLCGRP